MFVCSMLSKVVLLWVWRNCMEFRYDKSTRYRSNVLLLAPFIFGLCIKFGLHVRHKSLFCDTAFVCGSFWYNFVQLWKLFLVQFVRYTIWWSWYAHGVTGSGARKYGSSLHPSGSALVAATVSKQNNNSAITSERISVGEWLILGSVLALLTSIPRPCCHGYHADWLLYGWHI